ncbi:hypothetical protein H2203_002958 [Taxawa tesnikishii (nom. ined.)]|nr:hypothetical protein H2203_002958 [Dothideales sp. JES 119]
MEPLLQCIYIVQSNPLSPASDTRSLTTSYSHGNSKRKRKMSAQAPGFTTAPSDKETPEQNRGLFHHEGKKHECHHYARMYGGKVANAAMWGFELRSVRTLRMLLLEI